MREGVASSALRLPQSSRRICHGFCHRAKYHGRSALGENDDDDDDE